jgi:hypothetical protein
MTKTWLGDDEGGDDAADENVPPFDLADDEGGADSVDIGCPQLQDEDMRTYMAFCKSPSKSSEKAKGPAGTYGEEDLENSVDDTFDEDYN